MRLIDSDALRKRLIKQRDASAAKQNYGWEWEYNGWNGAILQIGCEMIEHPVDAVPVRHGRWTPCEKDKWDHGAYALRCSECGGGYHLTSDKTLSTWNYCPDCGARMDEE